MRFVFDIDGTLCFDGRLSARPIRDLLPVLPSVFHQHTLIGANGAMISQQSKISVIKPIHTDTYHHILKIIQKYELDYIIDDDWNYAAQLDAENAIFERLDPHKLASCIDVANIDTPIKIILLNIDVAQITTILDDELNKCHQELEMIHHSNEYNIDITAQNINKYTALQYIFDADVKYIAFGNDHNDIVMLQHASSGYIIGPSEAYTQAILKLDKIKHIDNNAQAICKVLKSYK
ncbi:HAD hydrolase family protein [Staphylococcus aureus]|nr:HAD hydrolase family protein [Staphylococcus aureus]HEH0797997.1 HAD hydrolase family protein [Staphylococcus aureus]HEJ7567872.1 HAD hydrolase family protein [Staphylococcus aureus]